MDTTAEWQFIYIYFVFLMPSCIFVVFPYFHYQISRQLSLRMSTFHTWSSTFHTWSTSRQSFPHYSMLTLKPLEMWFPMAARPFFSFPHHWFDYFTWRVARLPDVFFHAAHLQHARNKPATPAVFPTAGNSPHDSTSCLPRGCCVWHTFFFIFLDRV